MFTASLAMSAHGMVPAVLLPRQRRIWQGADRTILGKISKRGNRYLRVLFVQAGAGQTKPVFDVVLNFGFADRWKLVLQGTAQSLPEGVGPLSVS